MSKKKKHRSLQSRDTSATPGFSAALRNAACGVLIACAVGALLLLVVTAAAYAQDDPDSLTMPLGYAVAAVVALTAGAITARRNGRAVLLCGLLSAAILLLVFTVLSLFPHAQAREPMSVGVSLALHAALLPLSCLGAYLGRRRGRR